MPVWMICASTSGFALPFSFELPFLPHLANIVCQQSQNVNDVEPCAEILKVHVEAAQNE